MKNNIANINMKLVNNELKKFLGEKEVFHYNKEDNVYNCTYLLALKDERDKNRYVQTTVSINVCHETGNVSIEMDLLSGIDKDKCAAASLLANELNLSLRNYKVTYNRFTDNINLQQTFSNFYQEITPEIFENVYNAMCELILNTYIVCAAVIEGDIPVFLLNEALAYTLDNMYEED